jgi:hypothetical protein
MTFLHKLAQRLARMKTSILMGVLLTSACEQQLATAGGTVPEDPAVTSVVSVSVTPGAISATTGQTVQLTAIPRDANGIALSGRTVTWRSSNTTIVTVNANGLATEGPTGSATITATIEGKNGTAAITVTQTPAAVALVTVTPAQTSTSVGLAVQLTATLKDASGNVLMGRSINWGSSNAGVATVSGSGLVTALAVGAATITASSDGKSTAAAFTVMATTEPAYNPTVNRSLFYDDYETYGAVADLTVGPKAKYWLGKGNVALGNTSGGDYAGGAKFARFTYSGAVEANEVFTNQHHSPILDTASVVIVTYGYRNTGTYYSGKEMIIQNSTGSNRFVLVGISYFTTPQSLQNCWYGAVYPFPPLNSSVQPRGTTSTWSRDGLASLGGPSPHFLAGNAGYPAANLSQKNDGRWHRFTYRFTKESAAGGTGRLEGWFDGAKFMEYIGDDPTRCEYRQVWTWGATNTIWNGDWYFIGTTSGAMGAIGPSVVDMDGVRMWLP